MSSRSAQLLDDEGNISDQVSFSNTNLHDHGSNQSNS